MYIGDFTVTLKDLERKYRIVYIGGNRYYNQDLAERQYNYENTIPCYFSYKEVEIYNKAWKNMLCEIVKALDSLHPKSQQELLEIVPDWSKSAIFSDRKKSNHIPFKGIFINCNHTALHAMWTIQLILNKYNIPLEECEFIIKRSPKAEPSEVRDFIRNQTISSFIAYLKSINKEDDKIERILKRCEYINKKLLPRFANSYDDLFLIDDRQTLQNCKSKILAILADDMTLNDAKKKAIKNSLILYCNFNKIDLQERAKTRSSYFRKKGEAFEQEMLKLFALDYLHSEEDDEF